MTLEVECEGSDNLRMKAALQEIAELANHATTQPTATAIPGVVIIKGEVPEDQLAAVYEPMIGFVVCGSKSIAIGSEVIHAKSPSYFVIPVETPATGRVEQGPRGQSYLSIGLRLHPNTIAELLKDLPQELESVSAPRRFAACAATPELTDAFLRLLRLLETPQFIPSLAPVYEREILVRVLTGP